jgi:hypothetical protein
MKVWQYLEPMVIGKQKVTTDKNSQDIEQQITKRGVQRRRGEEQRIKKVSLEHCIWKAQFDH